MIKNIFLIAVIALLLSSCFSSRKAKVNEIVNENNIQQQKELAAIKKIEINKTDKLSAGKIDSTIDKKIDGRLNENKTSIDSIRRMMDSLTASTRNRKTFRKAYRSIIKSKIIFLQNNTQSYKKKILNYGMIEDVLNNAKQTQFDLATFFGSGEYLIPADKMEQATKSFTPVVDSLLQFAGKYTSIPKTSTIVLKGYADAAGITAGSTLYVRLATELKQEHPSNSDLNLALSKLRAASISDVVNQIIQKKQPDFLRFQIVNIELVQEGRGEEKPNPAITDYTENDGRRRIVLFFWSLLPK